MKKLKINVYVPTRGKKTLSSSLNISIDSAIKHFKQYYPEVIFKVYVLNTIKKGVGSEKYITGNEERIVINSKIRGKVNCLRSFVGRSESDFFFTLDDDVSFASSLFIEAYKYLLINKDVDLVSFQTAAIPYPGNSYVRKFQYNIINCRSLNHLFLNDKDPFLVGRFLFFRGSRYPIPKGVISDDMYLTVAFWGKYRILDNYVYYLGVSGIYNHIKRMIVHKGSYLQIANLFPSKFQYTLKTVKRRIDKDKLKKLPLLIKINYSLFKILQYFSYNIAPIFSKHRDVSWNTFSSEVTTRMEFSSEHLHKG